MRDLVRVFLAVSLVGFAAAAVSAQERPASLVEGGVGYFGKVDESPDPFLAIHGGTRVFVTNRISVGPEVTFLRGEGLARDWIFTGNLTVDLRSEDSNRTRRVVPYVIARGGFQTSRTQVGTGPYRSNEGALTGGVGLRIALGDRWYVAPETRIGWEGHLRFGVTGGWRLR